jgi:hypothetical protein
MLIWRNLGSLLVVLGTITSIFGTNAIKYSHSQNSKRDIDEQVTYVKRGDWWFAFLWVVVGGITEFFALGMTSQSYATGLAGATALIANVLFARHYNKEKVSYTALSGIFLVIVGCCLFVLITPRPNLNQTQNDAIDKVIARFSRIQFVIYIIIQGFLCIWLFSMVGTSAWYRWRANMTEHLVSPIAMRLKKEEMKARMQIIALEERIARMEEELDSVPVNRQLLVDGVVHQEPYYHRYDFCSVLDLHLNDDHILEHWSDKYLYASSAGIIGGMADLFASCLSRMMIQPQPLVTLSPSAQALAVLIPFWLIMGLILTVALQVHLLNMALVIGDISTVFPLFQACWTLSGVVGGVIFYDRGTVDLGGTACLLFGALLLLQHGREKQQELDEEAGVVDDEKLSLLSLSRTNSSAQISASMSRSSSSSSFGNADTSSLREKGVPANASPRHSPSTMGRNLDPADAKLKSARRKKRTPKPSSSASVVPSEEAADSDLGEGDLAGEI